MAVLKHKPTSPGSRFVVRVKTEGLHKGKPHAKLLGKKISTAGRNNAGRITVRHRGGGHKKHIRSIDFRRNKIDIPGKVETIEYDPNRTAHLALICYRDGERRYIIAPKGVKVGDEILSGNIVPVKIGNCMPIRNIPVGTQIHCIELKAGKGAQLARSAGGSAQLVAKEGAYGYFKIEIRRNEKSAC